MPNAVSLQSSRSSRNSHISWYVDLRLRPGAWNAFLALTKDMVERTRLEAGVLVYERFVNADRTIVSVYERYVDSAAALSHLIDFREQFGSRFAALAERRHFIVMGEVDDALRHLLSSFGATFTPTCYAGFVRPERG